MTFTPVEDFTPAQHVAKALFKLVNDSFLEGLDQTGGEWMIANKATAAKVYRFHHAMAWFWADQIIQAEEVTDPSPEEFMGLFREIVFTKVMTFFPGMSERGGNLLWATLNDDDAKTPGLISSVIARNPPYLGHAILKEWMAAQGVSIDNPSLVKSWMTTAMSAPTADQVRAALKAGG
ncbi:hypothetical protein [Brevundimonas sp.]|uniref:hypothetical protein n=1 Tax=Brevundimonas sp. TaxID=1871086 RepID=UPI00289FEEEC|nr:hypothetical protein [Brevundimonas sp.]